jgi:cysteine desulfurase family protein (TIGR01976 family)
MTTLNFLISRAFGRTLRAGDQILTTALDHDANVAPWLLLAEDLGLEVREVRATSELRLDIDDLREKLTPRTRAVAFTLASNAVGSLTQARLIADLAHEAGALAWVDAVHYAAHRRIDVAELRCDVLLCSPYKFYGPHLGMAWMRPDLAAQWPAERVRPATNIPPGHRFETGTLSHEALAGFVAAVEYLASLGSGSDLGERLGAAYSAIADHERRLAERFLAGLRGLRDWQLCGIDGAAVQDRVATFGLLGPAAPTAMARYLDKLGIYCWNGSFYALNLMRQLGLDEEEGLLRLGFCHYNTTAEVDRLLAALAQMPPL